MVLHGAAQNNEPDIWKALGDPRGKHAGLPMQLLASGMAPSALADNFCVVAPYSVGKRSFYEDSRDKILNFVQWLASDKFLNEYYQTNSKKKQPWSDPTRVFLFGFSDGATVAAELATSRRFRGVVVASYGFTGESLPAMALQRLRGVGFWVFHSADDVIFDVGNSDRLVAALQRTNSNNSSNNKGNNKPPDDSTKEKENLIRYTRFDKDPLPRTGILVAPSLRGHTMGIVAAQSADLHQWLLSL